jgi:cell division protein FtsB
MNAESKTKELRPGARLFTASRSEKRYIDQYFVLEQGAEDPVLGVGDTEESAWNEAALKVISDRNRELERKIANLEDQLG